MRKFVLSLVALTVMGCENSKISEAKEAVAYGMKDPDSVKFRDIEVFGDVVCGEVNSKNSYGAYAGYSHFIFEHGLAKVDSQDEFEVGLRCMDLALGKTNGGEASVDSYSEEEVERLADELEREADRIADEVLSDEPLTNDDYEAMADELERQADLIDQEY